MTLTIQLDPDGGDPACQISRSTVSQFKSYCPDIHSQIPDQMSKVWSIIRQFLCSSTSKFHLVTSGNNGHWFGEFLYIVHSHRHPTDCSTRTTINRSLAIWRPSGCTVASGVVVVDVCNRSQVRTAKCTCLISGVSIVLEPG